MLWFKESLPFALILPLPQVYDSQLMCSFPDALTLLPLSFVLRSFYFFPFILAWSEKRAKVELEVLRIKEHRDFHFSYIHGNV